MSTSTRTSPTTHLLNVIRGVLIGTAEIIPGISGGTVALITGVYEKLMTSAGHVLSGIKLLATDLPRGRGGSRAREEFSYAYWGVVVAVLVGMVAALLVAPRVIRPLLEDHHQFVLAVFFGLVLASLWIPYSLSGKNWRFGHYLLCAPPAIIVALLASLTPNEAGGNPLYVMIAASVSICALVAPGVSGAVILQTFGLYDRTMEALETFDLGYIATFAAGALIGLALFVKLLQWLLEHHHRLTLVVLTGMVAGALRALWPWQHEEDRSLLPPTEVPLTLMLVAAGFAVMVAIFLIDHAVRGRAEPQSAAHAPEPKG